LIPRLSHSAPASVISQVYGWRGPLVTYVSGASCALNALEHASMVIELGLAEAMLVLAVDEYTGPAAPDRGLRRLSGIEPRDPTLDATHADEAAPDDLPGVAALLLVAGDGSSSNRTWSHGWTDHELTRSQAAGQLAQALMGADPLS
jgi:hypothetical protein